MNDTFWQSLRYVLIGLGSYLAGRGKIPLSDVPQYADSIIQICSGMTAVAATGWGLYVRFRTKSVPEDVAARTTVNTVNAATGTVEPATAFTGNKSKRKH